MSDPNNNEKNKKKWQPVQSVVVNDFSIFKNPAKNLNEKELEEAIKTFELTLMDYTLYFIREYGMRLPPQAMQYFSEFLKPSEISQLKKDLVTGKFDETNVINYVKYF